MASPVTLSSPPYSDAPPPPKRYALQAIVQIAVAFFFSLGTVFMLAAVTPMALRTVVLISAALGAPFLAGFFFQPPFVFRSPSIKEPSLPPLLKPHPRSPTIASQERLSSAAPRGISDAGNNCFLGTVLQMLQGSEAALDYFLSADDLPETLLPFRAFYEIYQKAQEEGQPTVTTSLQPLREAISSLVPIAPSGEQEDAGEAARAIFSQWPERMHVALQETTHYEVGEHTPLIAATEEALTANIESLGNCRVKTEKTIPFFTLAIPPETPHLNEMLKGYFSEEVEDREKKRLIGVDGEEHGYARLKIERRLVEAPPSLFFQIKRFERTPETLLQKALSHFFTPTPQICKNQTEVMVPTQIQIPLANGSSQRYKLVFMNEHQGNRLGEGHYLSYILDREGRGYFCNGKSATRQHQGLWPLSKAYLLHYVREDEQDVPG